MATQGTGQRRTNRIITVTITEGSAPVVDPNEVHVSKDRGDELMWDCNGDFVVCFGTDTPFDHHHFDPGRRKSGPVTRGVPEKRYKYSVETSAGTVDPNVIVDQ